MRIFHKLGGPPLLLAGFGSLLLLMILAGVYGLETLEQVRATAAHEREVYLNRNRALDRVRGGIYQSGTAVRDYLLASDQNDSRAEFEHWSDIRRNTDQALAECSALVDADEMEPLRSLQSEIQVYWKLLAFIFELPPDNKLLKGSKYLSAEVVRHRMAALDLVDRVDGIVSREMTASDIRMNDTFDRLRRRLTMILALTVGVGVLFAAFTIWRTLRLETELEQRYREGKELSARLVSAQEEE